MKWFAVYSIFLKILLRLILFQNKTRRIIIKTPVPIKSGEVINEISLLSTSGFCFKNLMTCPNWVKTINSVKNPSASRSNIRSVIMVPINRAKEIFSYLASTPHFESSPIRGITRFMIYPIITAKKVLTRRGMCPMGSIRYRHRMARLIWLKNPMKIEIHIQK